MSESPRSRRRIGLSTSQLTAQLDGTYETLSEKDYTLPTGALSQTFPRNVQANQSGALASGTMALHAIHLRSGQSISNITFVSSTTAMVSGTHQWFALYSSSLALLAVTADDTSTAWGASTAKTLALSAPYVVLTSGLYYLGITVAADTPPTLRAATIDATVYGLAPIMTGPAAAGLTDPASAPNPAVGITPATLLPYAFVS